MKQSKAIPKKQPALTVRLLGTGTTVILLLIPFHALFTTWLGANFGYIDVFRVWKEIAVLFLIFVGASLLAVRPGLRAVLKRDRIVWLIGAYSVLHVALGLVSLWQGRVNMEALVYAWIINLRFPVFFCLAWYSASLDTDLYRKRYKLILWPAAAVIIFGLLQLLILPHDVLTHAGYGPDTIPAYHTVDQKLEYQRVQSTLRGPNPLGAYLIVVLAATFTLLAVRTNRRLWAGLLALAGLAVLGFTYSRSAWIGTIISLALLSYWLMRTARLKRFFIACLAALCLLAGVSLWALRDNDRIQNTFFHSDENSRSAESSNAVRADYLKDSLSDVAAEPFGRGPGTAGPASVRNDGQPARIAENYYLQIAQEVGVIGLGLFIAINVLVGVRLWQQRADTLALALFASLAGLSAANMFLHVWADDTVALLWWGLAGVSLARFLHNDRMLYTKNEQTVNKHETQEKTA